MHTLIEALGALALAAGLLLLLALAFVVWKVRSLLRALAAAGGPPPATIELVRAGEPAWSDGEAVERLCGQLLGRGFVDAGTYEVPALPGVVVLRGLVHPAEGVAAAVYEHQQVGLVVDLVTRYEDGTGITVTSSAPTGLDAPPGRTRVNLPGADASALHDRLLADRPGREGAVVVDATGFPAFFERSYAEEMAWRRSRGGATAEEIRRVAARSGQTVTDEQVQAVREHLTGTGGESAADGTRPPSRPIEPS